VQFSKGFKKSRLKNGLGQVFAIPKTEPEVKIKCGLKTAKESQKSTGVWWHQAGFLDKGERTMRTKGFTLIELMIVVAIIAIIAAIAIPSLLRSRMAANETASAAACKAYAEAQEIFRRTDWDRDGILEYSTRMGGDAGAAPLDTPPGLDQDFPNLIDRDADLDGLVQCIDRAFANAEGQIGTATPKAGYIFSPVYTRAVGTGTASYETGSAAATDGGLTLGYALSAIPAGYDGTGKNQFIISNTGTIYQIDGEQDPAVHIVIFDTTLIPPGSGTAALWTPAE
jgi:prepilin-type N-terminal cleavage/methylation domain-containing protein